MPATNMATKGGKRTSNTKATRKLSVNFDDNEYILGSENGEDATLLEDSSEPNDRVDDILAMLLQNKGKKSTTHEKALRNRRNEIVKNARDKADALKQETEAKFEQCRNIIRDLRSKEKSGDDAYKRVCAHFAARVSAMEQVLVAFQPGLTTLRDSEVSAIEANREIMENLPRKREASRKSLKRTVKKEVGIAREQQKLAADESVYIREFRKLVLI